MSPRPDNTAKVIPFRVKNSKIPSEGYESIGRFRTKISVPLVAELMLRDWRRGVSTTNLSRRYGYTVAAVNDGLRVALKNEAAQLRRVA